MRVKTSMLFIKVDSNVDLMWGLLSVAHKELILKFRDVVGSMAEETLLSTRKSVIDMKNGECSDFLLVFSPY